MLVPLPIGLDAAISAHGVNQGVKPGIDAPLPRASRGERSPDPVLDSVPAALVQLSGPPTDFSRSSLRERARRCSSSSGSHICGARP
jgi:hypothetical protein